MYKKKKNWRNVVVLEKQIKWKFFVLFCFTLQNKNTTRTTTQPRFNEVVILFCSVWQVSVVAL